MKYYKNKAGVVFAYETVEQRNKWGTKDLIEMTADEIELHLNPPLPTPAAPGSITRAQGKAALIQRGLWPSVLNYAASIEDETDRQLADVALNDTTDWQRSSPFLNAAAQALGLTDEQIDELFIEASQIQL